MLSNQNKPELIHDRHQASQFAGDPAIVATAIEVGIRSVNRVNELPPTLRRWKDQLPGLLFWHHQLGGDSVPQFRPDTPNDVKRKYLFPTDIEAVISIVPAMQARLVVDATSCAKRILIVEGTKQNLFASTYAPDDVVAVGIQGCWNWSNDGQALTVLDGLCKGREVVIAFDADINSNENVYRAGERLAESLTVVGATSVKFLILPASGGVGLDDFLAQRERGNRGDTLLNLIAGARKFSTIAKPKSKARRQLVSESGTFDMVSIELGEVVEAAFESIDEKGMVPPHELQRAYAGEIDGRRVRRVDTLLTAAPIIVATVEGIDDLTPGSEPRISFDLDVQNSSGNDATHRLIKGVPYAELKHIESWLERLGADANRVTLGRAANSPSGQSRVAEAVKRFQFDGEVKRKEFLRTGWYLDATDKTAYWIDTAGAHGPEGKIERISAKLEGSISSLEVPGFGENYTLDDAAKAFKELLRVCEYLHDATPWILGVSGLFWSIFGGNPDAVLYLSGGAGAGKSSIVGALSSMLGPHWGTGAAPMASVEGTTAYLSDVTRQIHNCMLVLDDARDRSSARSQENQDEALDKVVRVGYGGGGAARGKKVRDVHGDYHQSPVSLNRPFVVIAGESLPDSTPQSTIERCLVVEIKGASSLKASETTPDGVSGYDHLATLSQIGALRPALSYFIRENAKVITGLARSVDSSTRVTNMDEWRIRADALRSEYANIALAKHWPVGVTVSERVRKVLATFLAGTTLFTTFMVNSGFVSDEEAQEIQDQWHKSAIAAAIAHSRVNLSQSDEAQPIIDTLRGAVATGRARLVGTSPESAHAYHENEHAPIIGAYLSLNLAGKTINVVAVIVAVTSKILREEGIYFPPRGLPRRLRSVLIAAENGEKTHVKRIPGFRDPQRCYFIPQEAWAPRSADRTGEAPEAWAPEEEGPDGADPDAWLYEDEEPIEDVDEAWTFNDEELADFMTQTS
jgi:hypothetical protein